MTRTAARTAAVVAAMCFAATSTAPALAHGDDVVKRGVCSSHTSWKLKAKPDDGRLEVEGEVDSNHIGQTWKWRILHDGYVSYRGSKKTVGPSGSFVVKRRVVDSPGLDHIGWRAANIRTGERCRGSVSL